MAEQLTLKQKRFVLEYFATGNATQSAIVAGYSPKSARTLASQILTKRNIQKRLAQLAQRQGKTETSAIMSVAERKERLSEFGRETITGRHGVIRVGNISAIAELNKMEHIYTERFTNIENKILVVNVKTDDTKLLTERLIQGERTD